ncbi:gluconokinase [Sinorhizobium sp. BG8]|uniref:gluconokinase n=1 Tax=Sinorhizobium sp. BG8 TaxID=2613773 RepID=UPI00193CEB84|nr:gluconokinase [Sinorhizobium sp. BG8]QRM57061.1 gluconokinase [Sinorhizobium sp. BG8]
MSTAASQPVSSSNLGPLVVMGVSGCGKSSVGKLLASQLGYRFIEGDSRHPEASVEKMRAGIALDDGDRWPWLENLGDELKAGTETVVSCSALKRSYRDLLRSRAAGPVTFVFLQGSRATLATRLAAREGHYMPLSLLDSQLQTLELPADERDVMTIEIDQSVERIVSIAIAHAATIAYRRAETAI